ncbi:MAG: hypothetical protein WCO19_02825 [Candidatus Saccharibacteria bacterium]
MDPLNNDNTNPAPVTDDATNDSTVMPEPAAMPVDPAPTADGAMPSMDPAPMPPAPADPMAEMPAQMEEATPAPVAGMPPAPAPADPSAPMDETTVPSSSENMPTGSF